MSIISPRREVILRKAELESVVGLDRSTISRLVARGMFPPPIKIGLRAVGWRNSEVEQWLESRQPTAPSNS
ncbi:MAG: AlpA family phage regulatory protein [Deltaproteobacteria bacterium]|nr:AlpA family phage regulatory protein [Deltaproteobacteria bacterium]